MANVETELNTTDGILEATRLHWRAVAAGLFVTFIVYITLMSLGVAVGSASLRGVIDNGNSAQAVGIGAIAWVLGSVLISLFVGSYSSSRAGNTVLTRIGLLQGAVVTSAFFILMITQVGSTLGSLGKGLGDLTGNLTGQAANMAQNPKVTGIVEDSIGDLKFKMPADQVMSGVIARLIRGDETSAKNFLAAQSGISRADADERLQALNVKLQATLQDLGDKAAAGAQTAGWMAFATLTLSLIAGLAGGATGAQVSIRKPIETRPVRRSHPRHAHA